MSEQAEQAGQDGQDGWAVIAAAVSAAAQRLGERLQSAYAIGSLAHGGFAPAVSDVDLALLTRGRVLRMRWIVRAVSAEVASSCELGERLSVFHAPWSAFADPPARGARFPAIDRFDLMRYGVLVHGADLRESHGALPDPGEIRAHAVDSALARVTPAQLDAELEPLRVGAGGVHDLTKALLWPVRLQHVCDTGEATGNADAVAHYLGLPDARHVELVADALGWREQGEVGDPLAAGRRAADALADLHAEVFTRLAATTGLPRRGELADRAAALAG